MHKALAVNLLIIVLLVIPSAGFAATYYVPDDFPTIQAALNGADAGDEIIVRNGVYRGAGNKELDFGGKALTLRSENGAERCFIDCDGSGRGFYFHSDEAADSVLDGFSIIRGNSSQGGGIACYSSSPTITSCSVVANHASSYGGGIFCDTSSPTITNCSVTANTGSGGIFCGWSSSPTITNCSITANTGASGISCLISSSPAITNCSITANTGGGGISCANSSPTITNCSITANTNSVYGGGINCSSSSSPAITNCSIVRNSAISGGGICCSNSSPTLADCSISANTAGAHGGGIYCTLSSPAVTNCFIAANTAGEHGGGIACTDSSSPQITGCFIEVNTAGTGGGIHCYSSSPTITNCRITANTAGWSGGILCDSSSSPTITNCSITTNTATGGGAITTFSSSPAIANCILWNNSPNEIDLASGSISVTYSDVEGGYTGAGNINTDPLFAGDGYHLSAGSPCIDAGTDAGVYNDIDGDARPLGAGYDIGCDELFPPPVISCYPASLTSSCFQGANPVPQGLAVWNSGSGTLSYSISDDAAWLDCTPATGTSTGEADGITVSYNASGLAAGTYMATITISDPSASNNPQHVSVELTVTSTQLTAITLATPASESVLTSPPTFSWAADGGTNNVFAVDWSLSYPLTTYRSTYENLGLMITDNSWTMSASEWSTIPSGSFVYWRVRGANLGHSPLTIITSGQVWWFYKQ